MMLSTSPLGLSATKLGFSIVDSFGATEMADRLVLRHISESLGDNFSSLESAALSVVNYHFERFKNKEARIFPIYLAEKFVSYLERTKCLDLAMGDFVTDEESLGYPNIYWRIVRANSFTDVGPIHADRWFWDLSGVSFPNTHRRVKFWMPLIQNDENPSLMVFPGSHEMIYDYESRIDSSGKRKPVFFDNSVSQAMISAPVRVGQTIIFNDSLLHGGKVTDRLRVSLEFTLAAYVD